MSALTAVAPALPLHKAGPYVAAAYIVFVLILVVYLGIMGRRTSRTERELNVLRRELELNRSGSASEADAGEREREPVL